MTRDPIAFLLALAALLAFCVAAVTVGEPGMVGRDATEVEP